MGLILWEKRRRRLCEGVHERDKALGIAVQR